jgi:hypothetical protein
MLFASDFVTTLYGESADIGGRVTYRNRCESLFADASSLARIDKMLWQPTRFYA